MYILHVESLRPAAPWDEDCFLKKFFCTLHKCTVHSAGWGLKICLFEVKHSNAYEAYIYCQKLSQVPFPEYMYMYALEWDAGLRPVSCAPSCT